MQRRVPVRLLRQASPVIIKRMLRAPGEILVEPGQAVAADDVVGQVKFPGEPIIIHLSHVLNLARPDAGPYLLKAEGDSVDVGEAIAERKSRFPFLSRICRSPVQGKITSVDGQWLLIEADSIMKPLTAFVGGTVTKLLDNRGVVIETTGAYFEAACGLGGEAFGLLRCQTGIGSLIAGESRVGNGSGIDEQPVILALQSAVDETIIKNLESMGLAGLIAGSLNSSILDMNPAPAIPIVAMEGFGDRPMADDLFALFQAREDSQVSIRGAMPSDAEWERPLIIIPNTTAVIREPPSNVSGQPAPDGYVEAGSRIRSLRAPNSMIQGYVSAIRHQRQQVLPDIAYHGADVRFSERTEFVPWQNMEALIY